MLYLFRNMEKASQLKVLITCDPPLLPPQIHLNDGLMEGESLQVIILIYQYCY